jgi:MULE transposase domain/FAR1 DNA-binding domain/SWIM zinc finger
MDVIKPSSSKDKPEDSNKTPSIDKEEDQEANEGEDGGEENGEEDGGSGEEEEEEERDDSDSDFLEEIDEREMKKLTPSLKSTNQNLNVPPVKEEPEEPSNDPLSDKTDPQQEEKEPDGPPKNLDEALVPRLGMVFNSVDDAFSYFRAYAFKKGFTAIKRTGHNFEGIRYRSMFSCNQAGKPGEGRSRSRKRPNSQLPLRQREPRSIKTECPAMMVIKDEMLEDKWKVVSLHLEHNHPCTSDMIRFVKCFREIPESVRIQRGITDEMTESVDQLFSEITENFKYPTRPKKGELEELGLPPFGEVEVKALVKFLSNAQSKKPDFYHSWDLDEEGRIKHVFWADARSKAAYRYFNDVVTIEQARITARLSLPLIAIVGVNNHGQLVLLGCGILADETKESFVWLLKKWLRCMGGHLPEAVTTDYRKVVTEAVADVFPSARHRYCVWHILKRLGEKMTTEKVHQKESIIAEIKKAIYEALSVTDFEKGWKDLVDRFRLGEDEWLSQLYDQRKKWAPVYVNHMFWAGTSAVRRTAEKPDAFFDGLISTKSTLQQFLDQYDGFIKAKLEKEAFEDLRSFYSRQQFMSGLQFEEQIGELYTRNIFHLFQDEVKRLMQVICNEPDRTGTSVTYTVSELAEGKKVDFTVVYNPSDKDVWCICRSFQSRGILCSHTLAVLRTEYVMVIPNKYIVDRWRKDFKLSLASGPEVARLALVPESELSNYDDLYNHGHRYYCQYSTILSNSLTSTI